MPKKSQKKLADSSEESDEESSESSVELKPAKRKPQQKKKESKRSSKNSSKNIPKSKNTKKEALSKKPTSENRNTNSLKVKEKGFLPGQKYPTPEEDDGARAFYTSLLSQNSHSDIAKKYCLDYGLLDPSHAAQVLKELSRK